VSLFRSVALLKLNLEKKFGFFFLFFLYRNGILQIIFWFGSLFIGTWKKLFLFDNFFYLKEMDLVLVLMNKVCLK